MKKTDFAFLFDLDGVIIDSEKNYTLFWSEMDRLFPTGVADFSTRIKGMTLYEIYSMYFPDVKVRDQITNLLNNYEREMKYDLKPGVIDLLSSLQARHIPAVMVTSSNEKKMKSLWNQHPELKDYFKYIVTADQIKNSKPDPEGYLLAASLVNAKPKKCIVFEDSLQGVKAGKNANAYVVGISGTLPHETLQPFSNIVIDSLVNFNIDNILSILN